MAANLWTYLFIAALVLGLVIKAWLALRQAKHVTLYRHAVPAAFSASISLDKHQKAADYTLAKLRLGLMELVFGAALLIGWTLLGGLDALKDFINGLFLGQGASLESLWPQVALVLAFALIGSVLELPLSYYQTFVLEERFGFNKMTLKLWLMDGLKGLLVGALIGVPILLLILWLMGQAGSLWWLWAWAAWTVINLLLLWVYPTWIAPLFNQFKPLDDAMLADRVSSLMSRCGFKSKGLFVMDGSKRSSHANAYFTGLGSAKRVVFFDTLLQKLTPAQVDAVLAHELGHFHHQHVTKRMVWMFAVSLAGFALLGWLMQQTWFYTGLGVRPQLVGSNDALALILFMMVVPVFTVFITPLASWSSRKDEFQADAYAVDKTSGQDLADALLTLYEDNASTLTPDPLYAQVYYSHPPATERLARLQAAV